MSVTNIMEFASYNIHAFNEVALDAENVDYSSIGAKKNEHLVGPALKSAHNAIADG